MTDPETIRTYDRSAEKLAEYFAGIGARTEDVERGLELAGVGSHARTVEAGCGDGRDAVEIVPRVAFYEGYDPSEGMLKIARSRLPETSFVVADALSYDYPKDLDVIYAFASFLHVPKGDMPEALRKAHAALRSGGILYLSLKERNQYEEEIRTDEHGDRMFYYYTPDLIRKLAGGGFDSAYKDHQRIGKIDWFTLVLRKK